MTTFDHATIKAMRDWIADCSWPDLPPEEVPDLTDDEVIQGVRQHYDGGLEAFLATMLIAERLAV